MYSSTDELALLFTGALMSSTPQTTDTTQVLDEIGIETKSDDTDESSSSLSPKPPPVAQDLHPSRQTANSDALPSKFTPKSDVSLPGHKPTSNTTPHIHPNLRSPISSSPPHPLFTTEQLGVDRRLLVNRKRQLKMYRVWMQGKFRKLP
jgi:tRNAThr (cytosine32-N3)-methyltransferase